ncbi:MAG: exo-alpha-sialidase [Chloroflexi bacterium]|nr:exo-alpha-sialidase [Chloroflexota bacterium]
MNAIELPKYSTLADDFYGQVKRSGVGGEETNIQPYITFTRKGTWIVCWTQTSEEVEPGQRPEQRAVCSRSTDAGKTWSKEIVIEDADNRDIPLPPLANYSPPVVAGSEKTAHEGGSPTVELPTCRARIPAWPVLITVPYLDRIYVFYWYNTYGNVFRDAGHLYFKFSDDDGLTWSDRYQIPVRRTAIDEPGFDMHAWNYGPPRIFPNGKVMFSFTKIKPTSVPQLFENWHTEVFFLVAENLLQEKDPDKLHFTTYPEGDYGLIVPNQRTGKPFAQEATLAPLSGGRLLTTMRTDTGYMYYATSNDYGATWTQPAVLRASPGGPPMLQPVCPASLVRLRDGRIVLLFHNNSGTANGGAGPYASLKNRTPLWIAVAREAKDIKIDGDQPANGGLIFGTPRVVIENAVQPKGKTGRTDISYQQFFQWGDQYFIIYNHRKLDINIHAVSPDLLDDWALPYA